MVCLLIMAAVKNLAMQNYDTVSRNMTQSNNKTLNNLIVCTVSNSCCVPQYFLPAAPVSLLPRVPQYIVWELPLCIFTQVCVCTCIFRISLTLSALGEWILFILSQGGHKLLEKWFTLPAWRLVVSPLIYKEMGPKRKHKHNSTDNCISERSNLLPLR